MNENLKNYIEDNILPQYINYDKAHQRDHIETVIEESLNLADHFGVDMDMAYMDYPSIIKNQGLNGYAKQVPLTQPKYQFVHVVEKGESPWSIAQKFLGDGRRYPEIVTLNNLKTPMLYVGQRLMIPYK